MTKAYDLNSLTARWKTYSLYATYLRCKCAEFCLC